MASQSVRNSGWDFFSLQRKQKLKLATELILAGWKSKMFSKVVDTFLGYDRTCNFEIKNILVHFKTSAIVTMPTNKRDFKLTTALFLLLFMIITIIKNRLPYESLFLTVAPKFFVGLVTKGI